MSNLTHLDISYNKLSALELDYMKDLPKLASLNVSGNVQLNLADIRPVFQNLTELRSLSIADITNLPLGIFVPLGNLQVLNISGTHLNNETLQILNPLAKLKVRRLGAHSKLDNFSIRISNQAVVYYSRVMHVYCAPFRPPAPITATQLPEI